MFLAIDIGNSLIKFGIFESSHLIDKFSIPTARDYKVDEFRLDRLRRTGGEYTRFDAVAVSSVVPELDRTVENAMVRLFNVEPQFICHTSNFGIRIKYEPPEAAGIDRLVNASAGAAKYGSPVIVCSFGTAATFDVVNSNGEYIGGAIAPGMRLMAEALHLKTSKLPLIGVEGTAAPIGRTTVDSIRSGVFHGYMGLVGNILVRMREQLAEPAKVVGTGGLVKTVAAESSMIDVVDEDLTLDGIRLIAERQTA